MSAQIVSQFDTGADKGTIYGAAESGPVTKNSVKPKDQKHGSTMKLIGALVAVVCIMSVLPTVFRGIAEWTNKASPVSRVSVHDSHESKMGASFVLRGANEQEFFPSFMQLRSDKAPYYRCKCQNADSDCTRDSEGDKCCDPDTHVPVPNETNC